MKILAVADPHGFDEALREIEKKAKKAELVLVAGDITVFERDMRPVLSRLNRLNKPVLVIPGNHEYPSRLRKEANRFKNILYVDGKHYEHEHVLILSCEGDGFMRDDPKFRKCTKKFHALLKKKRKENTKLKVVLMTHGVPYNTKLDYIYGEHVGNRTIRQFIERTQPDYAISGHLHETFEKRDKIKKTVIMNPGPFGKMIRL
jgi:Icc-related predicted phosphoesterase